MAARKVLIVDDDEAIREVVATCLELVGGFDVRTAASGAEGFDVALAELPDAILLDVMMPGMDGPALFRKLQAEPRTAAIPVVLLTAKAQAADREALGALGVAAVLTKPFDPMALSSQIAAALGW